MTVSPCKDSYITSSADANIVKHPFPSCKSIFKTDFKPIKIAATRHSGQQGLSCRSDGRLLATAGWDAAVRVYSSKTLKELAVLKWHKEGCYATAFASVGAPLRCASDTETKIRETEMNGSVEILRQDPPSLSIQQKRDHTAQSTHWVAVGSKDGKVSLWDMF